MAAGDIALKLLVTAQTGQATGLISAMGGTIRGIFSGISNSVGNLGFGFKNLGTSGTIGMDAIKQGAQGLGMGLLGLGAALGTLAVGVSIALGVVAVKAAGDFQQGLNRLVTGAGDMTDNMTKMGQSILAVSTATGVLTSGTDGLNSAMYQIISSGQRGAQAVDTLSVAAKGSVVEQAKMVDVAKALTTAMTDYGTSQFNATQFMNGYTVAVQRGKITLEELSNSMGPLLPIAKNLGISFADVAGAMSTMTNAGIPATRAATSLRFMMASLENPTAKAKNAMTEFGLSSVAVANEMKISLPGALQMVIDAAKKAGPEGSVPFNNALSDMIGGSRSLQAALSLTGTHMKDFSANSLAVSNAMKGSKSGVLGWEVALSNMNVQVDRAKAMFSALMIQLGTQLMPIFQQLMAVLMPIIAGFLQWVIDSGIVKNILAGLVNTITFLVNVGSALVSFFKNNEIAMDLLKAALITLGLVILSLIIPALVLWVIEVGILAVENVIAFWPVYLIILAIVIVIGIIILVIQHWGQIMSWVGGVFSGLGSIAHAVIAAIGGWFSWLGTQARDFATGVKNTVGGWFDWLGTHVHNFVTGVKNAIGGWFSWLGTQAHNAVTTVGGWFSWLGTSIHNFGANAIKAIAQFFDWLYNHNYYWKAMVDAVNTVKTKIGLAFDWLGTHIREWSSAVGTAVGNFFSMIGTRANDAKNAVGGAFDWLGTHVKEWCDAVGSTTGNFFSMLGTHANNARNAVGGAFDWLGTHVRGWCDGAGSVTGNFFSMLGTHANQAKNAVGGAFDWLGTHVHDIFNGLMSWIGNFFSGLARSALGWGRSILQGLIDGINSMLGALGNAVGNAAAAIANALGFHHSTFTPPKNGPASRADTWMPSLMLGLIEGIQAGVPGVAGASLQVAKALALSANPFSGSGTQVIQGTSLAIQGGTLALSANRGTVVVQLQAADINLDKRKVGDVLFTHQMNEMRRQPGVRSR